MMRRWPDVCLALGVTESFLPGAIAAIGVRSGHGPAGARVLQLEVLDRGQDDQDGGDLVADEAPLEARDRRMQFGLQVGFRHQFGVRAADGRGDQRAATVVDGRRPRSGGGLTVPPGAALACPHRNTGSCRRGWLGRGPVCAGAPGDWTSDGLRSGVSLTVVSLTGPVDGSLAGGRAGRTAG